MLGPLRVEVGGRPVDVGGPSPRRLLATLVAFAGEVVSIDTLVDAVWGEDPPRSAVKTLRSHVARLRVALDTGHPSPHGRRGESGVIVTAPPGYRLVVPPEAVDAHLFVELVRRAGRAVDQAALSEADRLLTEAFGLWRGPPYAEFSDLDVGVAEARRLEEVRLTGLETRLEAGLLAGRHAEVVAEAEALCATHPLRERFWAQLVTALYSSGRQADALAAYERVRARLADEVGADPGPALRGLQQRLLRQDPALDAPSGAAAAQPGAVDDGRGYRTSRTDVAPERRVATVMVAAIGPDARRGINGPDWADPELADVLLSRFRTICAEAITATGGTVIENNDDGVTAAFGVLTAHDDHVVRALHAALTVRDRCDERLGALYVGVAAGEVLRRGAHLRVGISGEPVRLAAALRHVAGPGEILLAERAVPMARHRFELTTVADRAESGGRSLRAAALIAARSPGRPRAEAGLGRTFVGRGDDLDALDAAYRRAVEEGRPHVVCVLGEAGIGKSTLVERFVDRLGERIPAPLVHRGSCLAYGQGITYGALADVLRAHLGLDADAAADRVRERLAGREILGLTLGLDAAGGLDPRDARELLHAAWVRLASEMVATTPTVLVLEDLHWAQPPLLDLIADLVTDVAGPLLIVATARPEYAEAHPVALGPRRRQQTLWLERLTDEQADTMLKDLVGGAPDEALQRSVLVPAEGNPFFIEELLGTLLDRGGLVATAGGWRLAVDAAPSLPDTVRSALAARIDCLGPDARATLQAASVAGRVFAAAAVARMLDPLRPDLDELVDRDFIRRHRSRTPTFTFKHALTRQAAYDQLPAARRTRLHAAFADVLAETGGGAEPGDLDQRAPLLAHHYTEAARPDVAELAWGDDAEALARVRQRAITWLVRSGELAIQRYASDEALALLHRALDLTPPPATQAALWRLIGQGHESRLDSEAYWEAMRRAVDVCDDPREQAEAYSKMAEAATSWGMIASAMPSDEAVEGWLAHTLNHADPGTPAHTRALITRAVWLPEHLAELAAQALTAAEQGDDLGNLGQAYPIQEIHALVDRRYANALEWAMKCVALVGLEDPHFIDDAYTLPIPPLMALGRFAEAREFAARYEAVAAKQYQAAKAHALAWRIEIEALAGEWSRVRGYEDRARQPARYGAHRVSAVRALLLCAVARARLGQVAESTRLERLADELAPITDDRIAAPHIRLALARGDLDRVAELMAHAPRRLKPWAQWWALDLDITRLDALTALGDATGVEAEATPLLGTCALLDAVAKRALAAVRRDPVLRRQAVEAFTHMDLPGHVAPTATVDD